MTKFKTPDLITLDEHDGDFDKYNTAVYNIYIHDFISDRPFYKGNRIGTKKHPLIHKKEYTYYHLTHDGDDEQDRIPNLRRMERIRYPRSIITLYKSKEIKVWKNYRKGEQRILFYFQKEKYLTILTVRNGYLILWTAYFIEMDHTEKKLLKEYDAYIKAETAQKI